MQPSRLAGSVALVSFAAFAASCGGSPPSSSPGTALGAPVASASARPAKTPRSLPAFENPGGMWMPHQMRAHEAKLKELGLEIDPQDLSDPTSGVLSAIVSLGGCSASFVSPEGLVATNHHCATGALQHNSTTESNLLKSGFLAATKKDERNNGPQARIFVTRAFTNVTPKITQGLDAIADDRERWKTIERRQKEIVSACEKGADGKAKNGVRCSVSTFYEGAEHWLVEQLEIRDVRLVWAPPSGVGNYGGEIDNWRWPRHTGDVSFFRAYVGKDGQPADYAPDNVPYRPAHHLKLATKPLHEGDLVFVAGYPARTNTLKTMAEVEEAVAWGYPRRQKLYEDYLARLEKVTKDDKEAQIRATSYVRRFGNALTNVKGQQEGLVAGGLLKDKEQKERDLRAFITSAKGKAEWGAALDGVAAEVATAAQTREADAEVDEILLPKLTAAAMTIVRMAEERPKKDAEREPDWQERTWARTEQTLDAVDTSYLRKVDEAVLGLALERASRAERGLSVASVLGLPKAENKDVTPATIAAAVSALYAKTMLGDAKVRRGLFRTASTASLRASKDPIIQLALRLRPLQARAEAAQERRAGRFAILKPKIMEALAAQTQRPFAPDANSTLRLTYGTVRGYTSPSAKQAYRPFTALAEVVAKNKGAEPFDAPKRLLDAQAAKRLGPYVDDDLGDVPVDFLADLHITGGNSGSATLDARGDLTGLVFDGNYEAMASDWLFVPAITRSIHVDVRYVLWLLDAVEGSGALLSELGVEKKL